MGIDGDLRPARDGWQLELGQLDYHSVLGRQLGQPLDQRDADVAAEHGWRATLRQDGRDQ